MHESHEYYLVIIWSGVTLTIQKHVVMFVQIKIDVALFRFMIVYPFNTETVSIVI